MVTENDVIKAIESFHGAHAEAAKLADHTREVFDQVIAHLRNTAVAGTVVPPLAVVGIAGSLIDLEGKRDQILAKLGELLTHLKHAAEGIAAPYTFINYARDWDVVAGKVREAHNACIDKGDLKGYWEGTAADRYAAACEKQKIAFGAADDLCKQVHNSLLTLSESGRHFYAEIATAVTDFVTAFAAVIAKIATVVGAPFGVDQAIDLATSIAAYVLKLVNETTEFAAKQVIVSYDLENATRAPLGLPGGMWPKATADTYSDASALDGTPSSWKVSE